VLDRLIPLHGFHLELGQDLSPLDISDALMFLLVNYFLESIIFQGVEGKHGNIEGR
jgi:hypothetical protein